MNILSLLDRIHTHITTRVVVDQFEQTLNEWVRRFAKWWFDLVKNGIVVVALKILADRADNLFVSAVYDITYFLFLVFCMSYGHGIYYYPLGAEKNNRITFAISLAIGALIVTFAILAISVTSGIILRAIEVAQTGAALQKPH